MTVVSSRPGNPLVIPVSPLEHHHRSTVFTTPRQTEQGTSLFRTGGVLSPGWQLPRSPALVCGRNLVFAVAVGPAQHDLRPDIVYITRSSGCRSWR